MLPLVQDALVQSYLKLVSPQLQEQAMMAISRWALELVACLKTRTPVGAQGQEQVSRIYWVINFTPKNRGELTAGLNSRSLL